MKESGRLHINIGPIIRNIQIMILIISIFSSDHQSKQLTKLSLKLTNLEIIFDLFKQYYTLINKGISFIDAIIEVIKHLVLITIIEKIFEHHLLIKPFNLKNIPISEQINQIMISFIEEQINENHK